MLSSTPKPGKNPTSDVPGLNIANEIWLSLATGPMLAGILGTRALTTWLQSIGQASEEVFRGDRLPILHFPHPQPKDEL